MHRLDGRFGTRPAACVEIFGLNEAHELYGHTFYNDGNSNLWQLETDGHTVTLNGTWSKGQGPTFRLRYNARVIEEGNALEGKWEQSGDGREWTTFLETRATKAQSLPNTSVGP